jgi:formylglycine-generating enzyme required for sulfatase activity
LPDEALLGFVEIPAGSFLLGSDGTRDPVAYEEEKPQHSLTLPRYFIGRYPVTVAQFRAFVEDSDYRPADERSLQGVPTHPVVNVSWYDARRYSDWLTEKFQHWPDAPELLATLVRHAGWCVTLPSEAEWEKTARGMDGRIYPWGDAPDPHRANYDDTGIFTTSAVGCFPEGVSPYGIQDMSGDVFEWTRSLWGKDYKEAAFKYPYELNDGREDLGTPREILRVLRGGAFNDPHWYVRCAYRFRFDPFDWLRLIGFRVVVRPCR